MASIDAQQTQGLQINTIDGLTNINADSIELDGVAIKPVDTTGLVPYTGANKIIDLNTQNIRSSYVPLANADLINKLYADATYGQLTAGTFGSPQQFSGYNQFTSTLKLGGVVFNAIPSSGTVSSYLALDSANNLISTTAVGASLTAGTSGSPQAFSGYNQFLAQLKLNYVVFSSTPPSGTASYYLAVDSANNLISTSSSGASLTAGTVGSPQQFTGYNQFIATLKLTSVVFTSAPASGTVSSYLALDSANNLITTTSASVPTQFNPTNLSTGTLYPAFFSSHTGGASLTVYVDPTATTLSYAPATGVLTATTFTGSLNGNANTATSASYASYTNYVTTTTTYNNASYFIPFFIGQSSTQLPYNSNYLTYNPFTYTFTTTNINATKLTTTNLTSASDMLLTVGSANTVYFYASATPLGGISTAGWNTLTYPMITNTLQSQATTDLSIKSIYKTTFSIASNLDLSSVASAYYFNIGYPTLTTYGKINIDGWNGGIVSTLVQSSGGNVTANSNGLNIVGYNPTLGTSYINFWSSNATNTGMVRMGYTGNGLGWCFEVGTGAVVSSVTSTGFNTNNVKSFVSNDLTLTGQSNYINMVCGASTVAQFVNTGNPGLATNAIRNYSATALLINGNGSGNILLQSSGTTIANVYTGGIALTANYSLFSDYIAGTNNSAIQYMASTPTVQYTALYNPRMVNCVYSGAGWNSGGYHLFTGYTPTNNQYALAAYHNGAYGGIISLAPGVAWSTLELEGAQVNVFCYGGLAVYTGGGSWITVSDERIKTNIKPLKTDRSLQRVLQAQTTTYNKIYKDPIAPDSVRQVPHIGVIAQQVKISNPHCISTWDDEGTEMYGVNYQDYTIHLIGAVQEQQKIIIDQKTKIEEHENRLKHLEDIIIQQNNLLNQIVSQLNKK